MFSFLFAFYYFGFLNVHQRYRHVLPPPCHDRRTRRPHILFFRQVRNTFDGSTLFTIAHRLRSIIDFDLVLVVSKGTRHYSLLFTGCERLPCLLLLRLLFRVCTKQVLAVVSPRWPLTSASTFDWVRWTRASASSSRRQPSCWPSRGGHFAAMVDALGKEAAQLRKMAKKAAAASAAKKKDE